MVSIAALICMAVTLVLCVTIPFVGIYLVSRRAKKVLRAFGVGAVAFFVSQILLRIPLMSAAVAVAPNTVGKFVSAAPVASFSAGLFEETARLILMVLLLKGFRRRADGIAFGLGHGGLEAILLVGTAMVTNLIFSAVINSGKWEAIARTMPDDAANQLKTALTETPAVGFLAGGVERIWAIGLHVALSLIIMMGIELGRRLLAWVAAVVLHGCVNLASISAMQHGMNPWQVELSGLLVIAALLIVVLRRAKVVLPTRCVAS